MKGHMPQAQDARLLLPALLHLLAAASLGNNFDDPITYCSVSPCYLMSAFLAATIALFCSFATSSDCCEEHPIQC